MKTRKLGGIAEAHAAEYLLSHGFTILEKNYFTKGGEIDIIFKDTDIVCFAEVKYRTGAAYGTPAEAVTAAKIKRISATALEYLYRNNLNDIKCRFDIIEVTGREKSIRHIKNAFEAIF